MSNELMIKKFEDVEVFFMESGWVNATCVAKKFGKLPADWLRLDSAKEYIAEVLSEFSSMGNPIHQLVVVRMGSPENGGGTWLHPELAVEFARWLSVKFARWCDKEIKNILLRINSNSFKPQFPTELHPLLHFLVVGNAEDTLMKQTRNTYMAVLDSLGFAAAIYKRVLTNNVSRILIGMPIKPFRRLHGIPAGSRRRTRLYYDSDLRRTMDEIEDISCSNILRENPQSFEEIEKIVYQVAETIRQYVLIRKVNLLEHVPQREIDFLLEDAV